MAERAEANDFAKPLEGSFNRLNQLETRVSSLEESVNTAVVSMMPKVEELLSRRGNTCTPVSIASGATPRAESSTSLLELAEQGDHEAILRFLCEETTNTLHIHQRTAQGDSALHVAAIKGHLMAVMALLSKINVDDAGYNLRTPLHCAAAHGHLRVAERLLDAGAPVNAKDADGKTAMALAHEKGCTEIQGLLVRYMARPTIALQGIPMTHSEVMNYLQQRGLSIDACKNNNDTLLLQAARNGKWDAVEFFLERGVSATKCMDPKECALVLAARRGQADTVRLLLRRGAALDTDQVKRGLGAAKSAAVVWAIVEEVPDSVRGEAGKNGLLEAANDGRLETMQALLDWGVDVNCKNLEGETALHLASSKLSVECVRQLLHRGADVNAPDNNGNTPLHACCIGRSDFLLAMTYEDCLRLLLIAGASKTKKNHNGKNPVEVTESDRGRNVFKNYS